MISDEAQDMFYDGKRGERMPFVVGDMVRIKEGPRAGAYAVVVSLRSEAPEIAYDVEYGIDGKIEPRMAVNLELYEKMA